MQKSKHALDPAHACFHRHAGRIADRALPYRELLFAHRLRAVRDPKRHAADQSVGITGNIDRHRCLIQFRRIDPADIGGLIFRPVLPASAEQILDIGVCLADQIYRGAECLLSGLILFLPGTACRQSHTQQSSPEHNPIFLHGNSPFSQKQTDWLVLKLP